MALALWLSACGAATTPTPVATPASGATGSLGASASASASGSAAAGFPTVTLEELHPLEIELSYGPDWPSGLDGSVWILTPDINQPMVHRLDPETGEVLASVPINGRLCQGIAAGFDALWACTDAGMSRIDPATNAIAADIPFRTALAFARPAIGGGRVWCLAGNVTPTQVVEIDPVTNAVVATHELDHAAGAITFADGAIWATAPADGLLLRLDAATGEVTVVATDLPSPWSVAVGAGSAWVLLYGDEDGPVGPAGEPTLARISLANGNPEGRIWVGTNSSVEADVWADDDAVWVRSVGDPFLLRINPRTNEVDFAVSGSRSGGPVNVIDGSVWTTSIEFQTVWRIDP